MAKKKKEKKGGKRMKKKELAELLISYFQLRAGQAFGLKQLFRGLKLTTHPLKMLCTDILQEMAEDGFLIKTEDGQYKLNDKGQVLTGIFQRKSNGKNSFTPDDGGEPIFIAERNAAHAMNGDRVKVSLCARRKRKEPEGQVIEILEHAKTTFVGTLKVTKNYAFLLTESSTLANDIFIPKGEESFRRSSGRAGQGRRQQYRDACHPGGIRAALYLSGIGGSRGGEAPGGNHPRGLCRA